MFNQRRDIFLAVAQGRKLNIDYVQTVIEVLTESPILYQTLQLRVSSCKDSDIHFHCFRGSQGHELPLLNYAKQFRLGLQIYGTDFIEKNGAHVGCFKTAFMRGYCACEGPFHMAKQSGFQ